VNFAARTLCDASQRVIQKLSVYFVMTQSGNVWINPILVGKRKGKVVPVLIF
jgi:hypothetical protein